MRTRIKKIDTNPNEVFCSLPKRIRLIENELNKIREKEVFVNDIPEFKRTNGERCVSSTQ